MAEVKTSTYDWLKELGAVRPMAPAADQVLVLGKWNEGFYPIEWQLHTDSFMRDVSGHRINFEPVEQWRIFGFLTHDTVTREDCERILRACKE